LAELIDSVYRKWILAQDQDDDQTHGTNSNSEY